MLKTIKCIHLNKFQKKYSLKSHFNSAAASQFMIHEAFLESLFEIEAISEFCVKDTPISHEKVHIDISKLKKAISLFSSSLHSHCHIEELGFFPSLHENMSNEQKHKFQTFHVRELKELHHLETKIKHIEHHDSEIKRKEYFKSIPEEILKLGQLIDEHFDEKDKILLTKAEKVMTKKDLLSIRQNLIKSFDELSPLQCENSFKLGSSILNEVVKLPDENNVVKILNEFRKKILFEDWQELVKRTPELNGYKLQNIL